MREFCGRRRIRKRDENRWRSAQMRDPFALDQRENQCGIDAWQAHVRRARRRYRIGKDPAVAMEHRQRPEIDARWAQVGVEDLGHRIEIRPAVRVHHAFGLTRRAARIVDRKQRLFIERRARHARRIGVCKECFVVAFRVAHVADADANGRNRGTQLRDEVIELRIVHEQRCAAVAEDVLNLLDGETDIERAEHAARERHRIVRFEKRRGIR